MQRSFAGSSQIIEHQFPATALQHRCRVALDGHGAPRDGLGDVGQLTFETQFKCFPVDAGNGEMRHDGVAQHRREERVPR